MDLELREYILMAKKKFWIIASIVLIGSLLTGLASYLVVKPKYEASSTLFVNNKTLEVEGNAQSMDVNTSIMLANTYKEIVLNPSLLNKVVAQYPELSFTREQLAQMIKVNTISQTPVMTITAVHTDYEKAVHTVNAVSAVFKSELPQMLQVDNVSILNEARVEDSPIAVTPHPVIQIAISFVVLVMFSIGLVSLLEHLDDSIKDEKAVEREYGIPNLGLIPKIKPVKRKVRKESKPYQKAVGEPIHESLGQ